MIEHRIERRGERLRALVWVDLPLLQAGARGEELVRAGLEDLFVSLFEVAAIVGQESEVGTVKWFDEARGYGFISTADRLDVFVHRDHITDDAEHKTLQARQRVRFKRREGRRSLEALDVCPLEPESRSAADPPDL